MILGKNVTRVDAYDKVTGRAKYTDDFVEKNALIGKVLRSTIANGLVTKIDTSEAEKISGVVKIVTCFDVPNYHFPTAGHPWSTDPSHQDIADRLLLNRRVRYYGDDIAAVIAENEIAAKHALDAIKVEYEEYPFVLDPIEAMKDGAPQIHETSPRNILKHHTMTQGDFEEAISEKDLIKVEGWYETPIVQHCHIETPISYSYVEGGRIVVVSSTQIPHIVRRIVGQALGLPWGKIRIVKPYIGGGFGNKQDALYEPLNAFLSTQVGGRLVKLEITREETFFATRVRHSMKIHLTSYVRPNGRVVASSGNYISNQGAYASHGHSVVSKSLTAFMQLYCNEKAKKGEATSIHTNTATAGAMRGYGAPQSIFAIESNAEDVAYALGMDPIKYRQMNMMPVGWVDNFSKNVNYFDSFNQCIEKGKKYIDWDKKRELYKNQTGSIRRGVGMALAWYNTAVWPIALEVSSCRMVLNQDGSVQLQVGDTEIGQGADTVFTQMAAETLGIKFTDVHIISTQDTDVTPFGTGSYASRQTYVAGFAIRKVSLLLKEKILKYAEELTRMKVYDLDIVNGEIIHKTNNNKVLMTVGELATEVLYSMSRAEYLTSEGTVQCKSNAFSFGCTFVEVEVDIPLGKVKILNMINVHDCGRVINPKLAEGQVHGGMSMAIGFGLSETLQYDEKTGKLLNDNLLDYKLSTAMDHPNLDSEFIENYEPTSAYGTKALGEPPTVSGAPAIRNAVLHATGVAINKIPLSPHILYPAFKEAGLI